MSPTASPTALEVIGIDNRSVVICTPVHTCTYVQGCSVHEGVSVVWSVGGGTRTGGVF